ncbi:MAG: hypothetical protein PHS05_02245 [Bacteroidales bacterium]|jgi:hypothetical protein|nr:hypothetical protein [Bacteroidales bacterium]MDY0388382.1 hypothetical protein [Methanolobus sp.]
MKLNKEHLNKIADAIAGKFERKSLDEPISVETGDELQQIECAIELYPIFAKKYDDFTNIWFEAVTGIDLGISITHTDKDGTERTLDFDYDELVELLKYKLID